MIKIKNRISFIGIRLQKEKISKSTFYIFRRLGNAFRTCKLLLQNPDLLMLDEPTNHLDIESIIWLEEFFQKYEGVIVLSFAIKHSWIMCNKTIELELGV